MSQNPDPMTTAEYDDCVVSYGTNISLWPEADHERARAYLKTPEGLDAVLFDQALATVALESQANDLLVTNTDADFLTRLQSIPENHIQSGISQHSKQQNSSLINALDVWAGKLFNPDRFWSPAGFTAQGAMAAVLLLLGMAVGAQQSPDTFEDYDISAGLFDESSLNNQGFSVDG